MEHERQHQHAAQRPRRPGSRGEHVVLLPGHLLRYQERWQPVADALPAGEVIVILPNSAGALTTTFAAVIPLITAAGHHVTTFPEERFDDPRPGTSRQLNLL